MGTRYGYARCSTNESKQDIQRQVRDLKQLGVDRSNVFLEYESGTKINRVELRRLLYEVIGEGDEIVATEVSRITRSTKQLCEIIELAQEKHFKLVIGSFVVDCTQELDPMTNGMLKMMGVFAEMERDMIRQRVKSGVANARSKGKLVGRPRLTVNNIPAKVKTNYEKYKDGLINKIDYARICSVSRPTLDKYISVMAEG